MYLFFWVFPRRLIKIAVCRRFGTLYQFHLQRLDVRYEVWNMFLFYNSKFYFTPPHLPLPTGISVSFVIFVLSEYPCVFTVCAVAALSDPHNSTSQGIPFQWTFPKWTQIPVGNGRRNLELSNKLKEQGTGNAYWTVREKTVRRTNMEEQYWNESCKYWRFADRASQYIYLSNQLDAQNFVLQCVYYMPLHVSSTMCSSSGGQNCIIQHLVSSHL